MEVLVVMTKTTLESTLMRSVFWGFCFTREVWLSVHNSHVQVLKTNGWSRSANQAARRRLTVRIINPHNSAPQSFCMLMVSWYSNLFFYGAPPPILNTCKTRVNTHRHGQSLPSFSSRGAGLWAGGRRESYPHRHGGLAGS